MQAWTTLREFYNRTTIHNRVKLTRRQHESKMKNNTSMAKHLSLYDKLVLRLPTRQGPMNDARKLVFLLISLPAEYEVISPIAETLRKVTLIEVK